ncbi:MAG: SGNH/GDSL hydrolase family protein [Patescibacteria group bacterium]
MLTKRILAIALITFFAASCSRAAEMEPTEWIDAYVYHADKTDLPRVLLIGDSIARGNEVYVAAAGGLSEPILQRSPSVAESVASALAGQAYIGYFSTSWPAESLYYTPLLAAFLDRHNSDLIFFNSGLHGTGTADEYRAGLNRALDAFGDAPVCWMTTTPIRATSTTLSAANATVLSRNAIAAEVMAARGVPTLDLYALVVGHPEYASPNDNLHYNDLGKSVMAAAIAAKALEMLPGPSSAPNWTGYR